MKKRTKNKIICILIVLILLLGVFPFSIFTSKVYATTAIANTKEQYFEYLKDSSITELILNCDFEVVNEDYNYDYYIEVGNYNRTLDLNGHTITINKRIGNEYGIKIYVYESNKTIRIINSKETGRIINNSENAIISVGESSGNVLNLSIENINIDTAGGGFLFTSSVYTITNISLCNCKFKVTDSSNKYLLSNTFNSISMDEIKFTRLDMHSNIYLLPNTNETITVGNVISSNSEIWYDGIKAEYTDDTLISQIYLNSGTATSIIIKAKDVVAEPFTVLNDVQLKAACENPSVRTIKLNSNITCTEDLDIIINGTDKILDLNGYTLTLDDESGINLKYYTNNSFLSMDGSVSGNGTIKGDLIIFSPIQYSGVDDVQLIIENGNYITSYEFIIDCCNYYFLTINGGHFTSANALARFFPSYSNDFIFNELVFDGYTKSDRDSIKLVTTYYSSVTASDKLGPGAYLYYVDDAGNVSNNSSQTLGKTYEADGILIVANSEPVYHTVTFDLNKGYGEESDLSYVGVKDGGLVSRPDTDPIRNGYYFAGWYTEAEGENEFDFDTPITSNTEIFAKWIKIEGSIIAPEFQSKVVGYSDPGFSIVSVTLSTEVVIDGGNLKLELSGTNPEAFETQVNAAMLHGPGTWSYSSNLFGVKPVQNLDVGTYVAFITLKYDTDDDGDYETTIGSDEVRFVVSSLKKGDINKDGSVTLYDAFTILKKIISNDELTEEETWIMDYNNDEAATLFDAFCFLKQVITS